MRFFIPVLLLVLRNAAASDTSGGRGCVAPGRCTPPPAKYTKVLPLKPRQQWNINGGFCGALSVQSAALAFGAWISQDLVRKATPQGKGHGSAKEGYEVLPGNIADSARNLKLAAEEWDYTQSKPQIEGYKRWLKKHLSQGHPVVMFPMCKGDAHLPYNGSNPNGGRFDHVEPLWGIGSDHPLDDDKVYGSDWILHGSDQDLETYYRTFDSLQDTTAMDGNCKDAQAGFRRNEMYPCLYDQVVYGLAITGLLTKGTLPTTLAVDRQDEPNVRFFQRPAELHGTVTVSGLQKGGKYVLCRFSGTHAVPVSPPFDKGYEYKIPFTADSESFTYEDPHTFLSSGATYYVAVADDNAEVVV